MIETVAKPESNREKIKKLREYHQPTFDSLKLTDAIYFPKMFYRPYGKTDLHVAFFASEINKGEDVYIEPASKDLIPDDLLGRPLFKWKFNPHFEAEYDRTEPNPVTGHVRFLIPVEEFVTIEKVSVKPPATKKVKQETIDFDLADANEDLPLDQLTLRDLAAILLKKPVSKKEWLNKLIID